MPQRGRCRRGPTEAAYPRSPICASVTVDPALLGGLVEIVDRVERGARAGEQRRDRTRGAVGGPTDPGRRAGGLARGRAPAALGRSRPKPPVRPPTRSRARRRPRSSWPGSGADSGGRRSTRRAGGARSARSRVSCSPPPTARDAEARAAADRAREAEAALLERSPRRSALDPDLLGRLCDAAVELGAGLERGGHCSPARFEAPVRARVDAGAERATELGAELRRLGADEVELRQQADDANERATPVAGRARTRSMRRPKRRGAASTRPAPKTPAEGDDRDELATRAERLDARREELGKVNPLAKRSTRPRRSGSRSSAPSGRISRPRSPRSRSSETSSPRRCSGASRRHSRRWHGTSRRSPRRCSPAARAGYGSSSRRGARATRRSRDRGRAAAGREEDHPSVAAVRRREGTRRDLVPVRPVPRQAVPVLPPRRGRGSARRRQHRAVRRAAAPLLRPCAVHRDHPSEAHDGGRRRALRRHDGRRRRLAGRLAAAAAARRTSTAVRLSRRRLESR